MYTRIALSLVALGALAHASLAEDPKETKLKSVLMFSGTHSAIRKERFAVVTEEASWKELWEQHRGKDADPPFTERSQEFSIDFETHYVVAVFTGTDADLWVTAFARGDEVLMRFVAKGHQTEGRLPGQDDKKPTAHQKAKEEAAADYCFVVLPKPVKVVVIEEDVRQQLDHPPLWKERVRVPVPQGKRGKETRVEATAKWLGQVGDKAVAKQGFRKTTIANQDEFEKVWKALRGTEKVPKVDFAKEFVLVVTDDDSKVTDAGFIVAEGKKEVGGFGSGEDGTNLKIEGFTYFIGVFRRDLVDVVDGRVVPKGQK